MRKTLLALLSFSVITTFLFTASASGPVFWRINTRAEVEKGDAVGVSIADNGAITLAPALAEVFDTKQAYIWSAVADNSGNVYLGTGHEGRVFKVDAAGKGSLLYKTSELDVMALAVDAGGNVYAGTSPDGKVYRITPGGEAKVFFEPKTKYIWSLAFDAQGRLLVGTGDKGIIFRVNADGTGAPLVNTTQTNITALKLDAAGNIIAGTDPGGMVLRISPDGKAFTLFDSAQREIRDLAVGRNGEIYALALAESAGSGASNASSASSSAAAPSPIDDGGGLVIVISGDASSSDSPASSGGSSSSPTSGGGGGAAKSALYRLDANGAADTVWDSKDAAAFAVSLDANGRALIGTGQKGRIFSVAAGQKPGLLTQTSEAQTSRFVRAGNQTYVAASNLGKLFKLGAETAASGTYTSSVREAATTAAWGRISWIGEGAIELQTRSGNTATPDSTWSDWSAAATNSEGDTIKSPASRFLQWRATLKRGAVQPRLREVTVSYLPRNVAPKITSLNFLPAGTALVPLPQPIMDGGDGSGGEGAAMTIPPRRVSQRGAISIQWQAEDRNGDSIEYSIFYRAANSTEFYPLKTGFKETYFTVDPNALPDGRYVFKVVASDAPSNPASLTLNDDLETELVEVDNTPPAVTADAPRVSGGNAEVTFRVGDSTSILKRAEYQLDGGAWKAVFPADGIADSKREEFLVKVALPDARTHVVAFRVFDANSNVGSAQVSVK